MSASTPMPLLHVTAENGRTTARFVNVTTLTEETAEAVAREFTALAARSAPEIVLDLGAIEFLSSITLAKLLGLNKTVRATGGRLVLANLRPDVRRVFVVSRLDRVLEIEPAGRTLAS